jgi:hypothetical protein
MNMCFESGGRVGLDYLNDTILKIWIDSGIKTTIKIGMLTPLSFSVMRTKTAVLLRTSFYAGVKFLNSSPTLEIENQQYFKFAGVCLLAYCILVKER